MKKKRKKKEENKGGEIIELNATMIEKRKRKKQIKTVWLQHIAFRAFNSYWVRLCDEIDRMFLQSESDDR